MLLLTVKALTSLATALTLVEHEYGMDHAQIDDGTIICTSQMI